MQSVQVAGVDVQDAHSAVVMLLALANGRLIEIGVPVFYAEGAIVVSGKPALIPPPDTVVPPAAPKITVDPSATRELSTMLPAFFSAFAGGDSAKIDAFAAPGVQFTGLNGEVGFGSVVSVIVPKTGGDVRNLTATVAWLPVSTPSAGPPAAGGRAQIEMTYAMTVVQRAGRWYVRSIGPSTTPAGPS